MNTLKIATWNLERPTTKSIRKSKIVNYLRQINADILILTETNSAINPGDEYKGIVSDSLIDGFEGISYKDGENRTSIWTKNPVVKYYKTIDSYTSVCVDIEYLLAI